MTILNSDDDVISISPTPPAPSPLTPVSDRYSGVLDILSNGLYFQ